MRKNKQTTDKRTKDSPKSAPKASPKLKSKREPKSRPIAATVITPEILPEVIEIYRLKDWKKYRSPAAIHCEGPRIGEFATEDDAIDYLKLHVLSGDFAFVERVGGKLGKRWHVAIESSEVETEADTEEGLEFLDPDELEDSDLLRDPLVRSKIENAKLRAQIEARNGNGHTPITELLDSVRALDEMRGAQAPAKTLLQQVREAKELLEIVSPRREVNPAPQPQVDPETAAIQLLAQDDDFIKKLSSGLIGKLLGSDATKGEKPWYADLADHLANSPQFPQIANGFINLAGNLANRLIDVVARPAQNWQPPMPQFTPQAPQQFAPQPIAQQTPAQSTQPVTQQAPQPVTQQAPEQTAPVSEMTPADDLILGVIDAAKSRKSVDEVTTIIRVQTARNEKLRDALYQILDWPEEQILAVLDFYQPDFSKADGAKEWVASLIANLSGDEGEESEFSESEI